MEIVKAQPVTQIKGYPSRKTFYEGWQEAEGIPIYHGYYVPDIRILPLADWKRFGGKGAFINFAQQQGTDVQVLEIAAGESSKPQRHFFETIICIVSGRGAATIWQEGATKKHTFEWQEGSLFSPPINCWYQLFNGSKDEPVRFVASSTAPHVMNLFHNYDLIFNNNFVFKDRFSGEEDYFQGTVEELKVHWSPQIALKTNFIANVSKFEPLGESTLAYSGRHANFSMSHNTICAHISEWVVGTYQRGHRHGPGAAILIIAGKGYSLLWFGDEPRQMADWVVGTMFAPAQDMYHQHFNSGATVARDLAFRWGSPEYRLDRTNYRGKEDSYEVIDYPDEDPGIRELYEKELRKEGVTCKMPPVR